MINLATNKFRSLKEYIELYEKKTRDKFIYRDDFIFHYLPYRGFCEMKIDFDKNILFIDKLCGDIRFWVDSAYVVARSQNLKYVGSYYIRNRSPKAYIRLLGYKIIQTIKLYGKEEIEEAYIIQDEIGKQGRFTPCHNFMPDGRKVYMITFEVRKNED